MSREVRLPEWLKLVNPVVVALQRLGLAIGTMRLLSVPGRKSGKLRTTPVSPLAVDGKRYIVAGLEEADWVRNVRAVGWAILARGRKQERVICGRSLAKCHTGSESSSVCTAWRATRRSSQRWRRCVPCSG